jgi:predicted transglutaminase-like cysteine proteinase
MVRLRQIHFSPVLLYWKYTTNDSKQEHLPKTDRDSGKLSSGTTGMVLKEVRTIGSIDRTKVLCASSLAASIGDSIKNRALWLFVAFFAAVTIAGAVIGDNFRINRELLKQAEIKYGKDAATRLLAWEEMIRTDKSRSDREKLEKVNQFFNTRIRFVNDIDLWGVQDYWATPFETLCRNAGDCEDFAIAKFFTLKAIGMPEEKINIMYVKALQYGIAHMVLAYYSEPGVEPLILDNLIDGIVPASKRPDLLPVFGFNGSGLWTAKQRSQGKLTGTSSGRLRPWQDLQQKMSGNKL